MTGTHLATTLSFLAFGTLNMVAGVYLDNDVLMTMGGTLLSVAMAYGGAKIAARKPGDNTADGE
jgi:hypothetical protein